MLKTGQIIKSPRGTYVEILENTPDRISFERTLPPLTGGAKSKAHRHTETTETFELLTGEAFVWLEGREHRLEPGKAFEIPMGCSHANAYTIAGRTATVVQTVAPNTRGVEVYFTSWLNWLEQGEADARDEPTILQLAAIIDEGGRAGTWPARTPVVLQRLGLPILALVARLKGVRAVRVSRRQRVKAAA